MSDNKKIKMILNGALGRMGGYVLDAVSDTNDIEILHGVDPSVTNAINSYKGVNVVPNIDNVLNKDIDVVVDFTNSEVTMDIVNKCRDNNVDLIINLQGDMPNIKPNAISKLVKLMRNNNCDIGTLASSINNTSELTNPNIVKVCLDDNNYALKFERDISLQDQQYFRHIGIYAYRSEILKKFTNLDQTETEKKFKLEQLRALDNNIAIKILITNFQHRSIDIENDLKHYEI